MVRHHIAPVRAAVILVSEATMNLDVNMKRESDVSLIAYYPRGGAYHFAILEDGREAVHRLELAGIEADKPLRDDDRNNVILDCTYEQFWRAIAGIH